MKKSFYHVSKDGYELFLQKDDLKFSAKVRKINDKLAKLKGEISGNTPHICDRCGEEFELNLQEDIEVLLSDGVYTSSENELENVMEFFDGFIDFDEVFISELEAVRSDYFYCKKCTN